MDCLSVDSIIDVMRKKGYRVYDSPEANWNLNIVGIRSKKIEPIKFDDLLTVFYKKREEDWILKCYPITTDPSLYYLKNPINKNGTAILKEGQYNSTYKIDLHKRGIPGEHKALCQRLGEVTVYRDNNLDRLLNFLPSSEETGMFGINIHRGPIKGSYDPDNTNYSAGCQVFAYENHFVDFMEICELGRQAFGNAFTYTLLNETDFE